MVSRTASAGNQESRYAISDPSTFRTVAGEGHEIAGLYALAQMDILVDLARLVTVDFFARPDMYKRLDDPELAQLIAELHARYGCHESYLSHEQRQAVFKPLFEDVQGDFVKFRDPLLNAAAIFAQWGQASGIAMLYEAVRVAHQPFKAKLAHFTGSSLRWSRNYSLPHLTEEVSYRILRDRGVSSVFGVVEPPSEAWPYVEDADGDQLVEEITRRLDPGCVLTRHDFSVKQRTALRGAEALAAVLDYGPSDEDERELDVLITRCYTWYSALHADAGPGGAASPLALAAPMPQGANGDWRTTAVDLFQP